MSHLSSISEYIPTKQSLSAEHWWSACFLMYNTLMILLGLCSRTDYDAVLQKSFKLFSEWEAQFEVWASQGWDKGSDAERDKKCSFWILAFGQTITSRCTCFSWECRLCQNSCMVCLFISGFKRNSIFIMVPSKFSIIPVNHSDDF